jgi:hypothetical protein
MVYKLLLLHSVNQLKVYGLPADKQEAYLELHTA